MSITTRAEFIMTIIIAVAAATAVVMFTTIRKYCEGYYYNLLQEYRYPGRSQMWMSTYFNWNPVLAVLASWCLSRYSWIPWDEWCYLTCHSSIKVSRLGNLKILPHRQIACVWMETVAARDSVWCCLSSSSCSFQGWRDGCCRSIAEEFCCWC